MNELHFTVEGITIAHRFNAPEHWFSPEYAGGRQRHGLVYVLAGSALYEMSDGERLEVVKDDLLYFPAGTAYLTRCGEERFQHITINFDMGGSVPLPSRRQCGENERTRHDMERIISAWTCRAPFFREKCAGMLCLFLCAQLELLNQDKSGVLERLQPALDLLENGCFKEELTVCDMAKRCSMSETYFRRLFFRAFHTSPLAYLTQLRIGCASDLLLETSLSVEEVGAACGYPDPGYFCRVFKKVTGQPPSVFRACGRP